MRSDPPSSGDHSVRGTGHGARGVGPAHVTPAPRPPHPVAAMTLVELLVVLAVIGIIVTMSVPSFTGYAKQIRLKATTRQVVGLLSLARSLAISSHEDHAVIVDPDAHAISIVRVASGEALEQVVRFPSTMTVDVQVGGAPAQESEVVFRPSGSLNGRSVSLILSDRDQIQTITVTGATGAVSVH